MTDPTIPVPAAPGADQPLLPTLPKIPHHRPGRPRKRAVPLDEQPLNGCRQMKAKRCPQCGQSTKFRRPDGTCFRCTWPDGAGDRR